jgi:hypothetical protein
MVVWIAAPARRTKYLVVDHYRALHLDKRQRLLPHHFLFIFLVSMPAQWRDSGGKIVRQFFGIPILAGLVGGVNQTGPLSLKYLFFKETVSASASIDAYSHIFKISYILRFSL